MRRVSAFFAGVLLTGPAAANIELRMADGDPYDRLWIKNASACDMLFGTLHVDFQASAGGVLLDTVRGGPGTKDPMPVEVDAGPIRIAPVSDGDRGLTVIIEGLVAGDTAIVTMDFDNEEGWWPGPRVEVFGRHIDGTTAGFRSGGQNSYGVFDQNAQVVLQHSNPSDCNEKNDDEEPVALPVS